jgi:hypothetical protein
MQIHSHNTRRRGALWAAFSLILFSLGCTPKPSETADSENSMEPMTQVTPAPNERLPTNPSQPSGGFVTPEPTTPQPVAPPVSPNPISNGQPKQPEPDPPTTPPEPPTEPSPDVTKPEPQPKPAVQPSGNTGFAIGDLAPDIHGEDLDNVAFSLSDYRGKVVVLDFWGDW